MTVGLLVMPVTVLTMLVSRCRMLLGLVASRYPVVPEQEKRTGDCEGVEAEAADVSAK
jgi:hypothetical protein